MPLLSSPQAVQADVTTAEKVETAVGLFLRNGTMNSAAGSLRPISDDYGYVVCVDALTVRVSMNGGRYLVSRGDLTAEDSSLLKAARRLIDAIA